MSTLKNFLIFCSGVDRSILDECPTDENKYMGIGGTVFFTGVLAFFSGGYALYTVFDSWIMAVVFGLIWGLMIFNLDRYIVSSMKSKGSWWRDLGMAFPRLLMAVLLALVISKPLELKIFEKEIDAELIVMEQEIFKTQEDKINQRYQSVIEDHKSDIAALKNEIQEKTMLRDTLALMALQEADGTGGSRKRNLGPIYKAKKQDADKAQAELDNTLSLYLPLIAEKEAAINSLNDQIKGDINSLDRKKYGGLAARTEALSRLSQQSEAIWLANIFIILLFISIETAPIFVKLISYRSPYDYVLHEREHVFEMANLERTTLLANLVKNKLNYDASVGTHRNNARVEAEKQLIDEALRQRVEELKKQSLNWDEVVLKKKVVD